jgi:hypothetical protein
MKHGLEAVKMGCPGMIAGAAQKPQRPPMEKQENWSTELYKGMEVHVTALQKGDASHQWDYTVRVCEPGVDATAESELVAESGDDADYTSQSAALAAGFAKGYAMVNEVRK